MILSLLTAKNSHRILWYYIHIPRIFLAEIDEDRDRRECAVGQEATGRNTHTRTRYGVSSQPCQLIATALFTENTI